jgi:2-polyprenyl-6-methoxyphenol hydroxylase-like FAD-dependent oxidoreductase
MPVERVLIVGAGLAGLALAIALRQRGRSPTVVERADGWATTGAGLYLVGAATRALHALGVAEAVCRSGQLVRAQTFRNHRGAVLAEVNVEAYWSACGPCLGVERAALHRLLAERSAGADIRFGVTVDSLQSDADEVGVRFSDGSAGRYDLVVGADGIRSRIRALEFAAAEPHFRGQIGWRFLAQCPRGITGWTVFLGRAGAFLLVPVGGGRAYCYADRIVDRPLADAADGRIARLQALFRDFASPVGEVLAPLRSPEAIHVAPIEEVVQEPSGRGAVVLIGDAAHAMSPNMACGAALAFEDALVLADVVARGRSAAETVREFARRRTARVDWVRQQTHRRDRLRHLPPLLRDGVLRLLADRIYRVNYRPLLAPP